MTHFYFVSFYARRLPHYYVSGRPIFITWRLSGSLPGNRFFSGELTSGEAFVVMDRILDRARAGPVYLKRPEMARMVVESLEYRRDAMGHFELHAYVVMANHVHLLITPLVGVAKVMQSLKRFTAGRGNEILGIGRGKRFWQDESYDRVIRDETEFGRVRRYIEMNPVKAGLVGAPEEYRWSSAWGRGPLGERPAGYNPPHKPTDGD